MKLFKYFLTVPILLGNIGTNASLSPARLLEFDSTPLYLNSSTFFKLAVRATNSVKLDIEISIKNDLYKTPVQIYKNTFKITQTINVEYNNKYTNINNVIVLKYGDSGSELAIKEFPIDLAKSKIKGLDSERRFISESYCYRFTETNGFLSKKEIISFQGFDQYYIPDYYHKLDLSDFTILLDSYCPNLLVGDVSLSISNINGVFNDLSSSSRVSIPLEVYKSQLNYYLRFKQDMYVDKDSLKMSFIKTDNNVKTNHFYFPINSMKNQESYDCRFVFNGLGIDKVKLTIPFTLKAFINTVGDCFNSEYCVISEAVYA